MWFGIRWTLGKHFLPPADWGSIFPAKSCRDLEKVVICYWEVKWIWQIRKNFAAQFVQFLKHWLCNNPVLLWERIGPILLTNASQVQAWQFSLPLIDSLSIILSCNSFAEIKKAVVVQMGNRPPITYHDHLCVCVYVCKFGFGKCFGASSQSNHWAGCHWLSYKIHFSLQVTI